MKKTITIPESLESITIDAFSALGNYDPESGISQEDFVWEMIKSLIIDIIDTYDAGMEREVMKGKITANKSSRDVDGITLTNLSEGIILPK